MAGAKAKTINLLLDEGTLDGVICIEDSSWSSGELYAAPRGSVDKLVDSDACRKYGVYLLLSEDMVYIGQSSDLAKRIKQHIIGKDWWERVIVLTTSDDKFDRTDIDYLESVLIKKATVYNRLDCDNKNTGNPIKVSRFKKVSLEQYLEEALFLMELIGVTVFSDKEPGLVLPAKKPSPGEFEIQRKSEAKQFLDEQGYRLAAYWNYARLQESRQEFWANPRVEAIESEWDIVLNNQCEGEIILISVPANYFHLADKDNDSGLHVRKDRPIYIDLNINKGTLVDRDSKCDFSDLIKCRISY